MWDPLFGDEAQRNKYINDLSSKIPLGTMGTPLDVAYAALYLASNEAKYVTGIELNVDGGLLAGSAAAPKKHADIK